MNKTIAISLLLILIAGTVVAPVAIAQNESPIRSEVELRWNQARKLGAKGQLPMAYWDLETRLKDARKNGASEQQWQRMLDDVRLLLNRAVFIDEMRRQKSAVEALLGRFDRALDEISTLQNIERDRSLTGSEAADDVIERLAAARLERQVLIDSLTVENRRLSEVARGETATRDSLLTALQVEVTALRHQLWETQLRADVAEADRSAAETVLTAKQEREAALESLRSTFSKDEAEILLTPDGGAVLHLFGISFAVGSAEIQAGHTALLAKVVEVMRLFPGASLTVEGHTDNTGSRQANLRLSRRRAESVARLLEEDLELMTGDIATEGFGPDRPLALNDTDAGRSRNRRIDVVIAPAE